MEATREELRLILERPHMFVDRLGSPLYHVLLEQLNLVLDGVITEEEAVATMIARRDILRAEAGM